VVVGGKGTALFEADESVIAVTVPAAFWFPPLRLCCCCCWRALARVAAIRCPVGPSSTGGPGTVRTVGESVTLERGTAGRGERCRVVGVDVVEIVCADEQEDSEHDDIWRSPSCRSSALPRRCLIPRFSGEDEGEASLSLWLCWEAEAETVSRQRRD
jgi:hypothetical protein